MRGVLSGSLIRWHGANGQSVHCRRCWAEESRLAQNVLPQHPYEHLRQDMVPNLVQARCSHMLGPRLRRLSPNRAIVLQNRSCVYCACSINGHSSTKEHVIGRRFVPKGSLDREWNLILRACSSCNGLKSELEDDLSAITMQPDAAGAHAVDNAVLRRESERKARNSISRRTGRRVAESREQLEVKVPFGPGLEFTFTGFAPPQVDHSRAYRLALMQLRAFFYFVTYNWESRDGGFWPGSFSPLAISPRSDWGNVHFSAFAKAVKDWEPRFIGTGASGFFVVAIRRHPNAIAWSWALEWNQNYRLIGFFGELAPVQELVSTFPAMEMSEAAQAGDRKIRVREEVALPEGSDLLFAWPESE
jgi:hypothetical protein